MSRTPQAHSDGEPEAAGRAPIEVADLAKHLAGIRDALSAGEQPPAGALLGLPELPGDVWVDMAGAAAITGRRPETITEWVRRKGPKRCPFPPPKVKILYRLHWPMSEIEAWVSEYEATGGAPADHLPLFDRRRP